MAEKRVKKARKVSAIKERLKQLWSTAEGKARKKGREKNEIADCRGDRKKKNEAAVKTAGKENFRSR